MIRVGSRERWAAKKALVKKLDVAKMRMLTWMCGVTKMDRIRNERIRGTKKVGEISKKEGPFKWYCGHVMRRDEEYVGRRVMRMDVEGGGGGKEYRSGGGWDGLVNVDLREKGLSVRSSITGLCGGNLRDTSTSHRSRKRCGRRIHYYWNMDC